MRTLVLLLMSSCPVAADPVQADVPPSQYPQGSGSWSDTRMGRGGRPGLLGRIRSRRQHPSNHDSYVAPAGIPGGAATGVPVPADGRLAPVPTGNGAASVGIPSTAARPAAGVPEPVGFPTPAPDMGREAKRMPTGPDLE